MHDDATTRRTFLAGTAAITTALGGCSNSDPGEDDTPDGSNADPATGDTPTGGSGESSLIVDHQYGDGRVIYIEESWADVPFYVGVQYNDGESATSDTFDAGEWVENYYLELETQITDLTDVYVAIHTADDGRAISRAPIEYDYVEPENQVGDLTISEEVTGDGEEITVSDSTATLPYYIAVYYQGGDVTSRNFSGQDPSGDVTLDLEPPIEGSQNVRVALHAVSDGREIEDRDVQYTVE